MRETAPALQIDLFTGALVDTRSRTQKDRDLQTAHPHQMELFSQREVAQFGVRAHPVMDASPGRLVLVSEDPRSDDERDADLQHQAEALTTPLFAEPVTPSLAELLLWLYGIQQYEGQAGLIGCVSEGGLWQAPRQ